MAYWFENLTKSLADEKLSRRVAIQRVASTLTGGVLALWLPGAALAQTEHHQFCAMPGTCSGQPYPQCNKHNSNCYCFMQLNTRKGICGCNMYCDGLYPCNRNSDCGTGFFCSTNIGCSCTSGWCVQACTRTCTLSAHGSGRTAAGV